MACLGRAGRVDATPQLEAKKDRIVKLVRTYAAQVEALNGLERGGEQKVTVEHVHVHAGGQAIVGSVARGAPRGEGGGEK